MQTLWSTYVVEMVRWRKLKAFSVMGFFTKPMKLKDLECGTRTRDRNKVFIRRAATSITGTNREIDGRALFANSLHQLKQV